MMEEERNIVIRGIVMRDGCQYYVSECNVHGCECNGLIYTMTSSPVRDLERLQMTHGEYNHTRNDCFRFYFHIKHHIKKHLL